MSRCLALAGAVLTLAWATSAQARLDGQLRDTFTGSALKSCFAKQKTMPVNTGISDNLLTGYCTCIGDYVADRVTADQLVLATGDIKRGAPPSWLVDLTKEASDYCLANIKDYVKPA